MLSASLIQLEYASKQWKSTFFLLECWYPNLQKTAALASWKVDDIKTWNALKGFWRLANVYSIYIKDYATHAAPVMDALKTNY